MEQLAQVGDIINVRFHRFKDGTIDTNMSGHHGIVIEVNGEKIKYVLLTSRKYKYENRPYTVEIHKNEIACVRLKAPVSFARTETIYETTKRPDIIGFVLYEGLIERIIRKATYYERRNKRKIIASKKKYQDKSIKKEYNNRS